jgi:hypothetical protein
MASLSVCVGCAQLKVPQEGQKYKLRYPATSVGGTELAQGTIVCGSCANQSRAGELEPVQLKPTEARSSARHLAQRSPPGELQHKPSHHHQRRADMLRRPSCRASRHVVREGCLQAGRPSRTRTRLQQGQTRLRCNHCSRHMRQKAHLTHITKSWLASTTPGFSQHHLTSAVPLSAGHAL